MNCKQARQQIADIPCAPASPQLQHHTIHCRACAELLAGQTAHHAVFAHLRAEAAALAPSASVEQAVLAALHNPANRSHDSRPPVQTRRWVSISALACATLFIAALLFFGIRQHRAHSIASAEDPFIAMPYVVPPAPYERTTVIRTQLSVQIMQSAGFQVHGEDPASTALADVLYGEDGRILALRLVSQPNPAFEKGSTDMTSSLRTSFVLALSPFFASSLIAQANYTSVAVQQPAWVGSPDWSAITVHVSQPEGQAGPVPNKPFSAIEVRHSQQVLADGAHIDHADTSHFFRDAQGRMRVEGTKVIVLFDPTIDATYTLHLQEKIYDQYSAGGGKYSTTIAAFGNSNHIDTPGVTGPVQTVKWGQIPYHSEPVTHVDTVQLGTQTINGLLCKGTRVTLTIPAHAVGNDRDISVVNERWYSDDLMVLVKSTNDDPRFGTSTYELKEISRAEPNSALFKLPEGFTRSNRH